MYQVIIVVHVLLGLGVIGLILMQQGKGADAGAAFGSGSSGSVFGAQGAASFLSRTTAILATLFFTTSLTLAVLGGQQSKTTDLMDSVEAEQKTVDVPLATKAITPVESAPVIAVPMPKPEVKIDEKAAVVEETPKVDETKATDTVAEKTSPKTEEKHAAKSEKKAHESDKKHSADKHTKKHDAHKTEKDKK
jgi:preprotein translocase subunit SecG